MKKSKGIKILTVIVLFLTLATGALFILRPTIMDNRRMESEQALISRIESGETDIQDISLPEMEGEEYETESLLEGVEPIAAEEEIAEEQAEAEGYAVISIPSIDLKMAVMRGADTKSLRGGAGWLPGSAEIGSAGNCVILGHRMKTYGRHFNRLDELIAGDVVTLTVADGSTFDYVVSDKAVMTPEEVSKALTAYTDGFKLTLVTCTPTGVGSHRLLVYREYKPL